MNITNDIKYIGVNDHEIDLFEGQYVVPNGMAYNSYAIIDEKIAIMDSVDARFSGEWIANVKAALEGRSPDYLVIQHMEPDHSSSLTAFMDEFPSATIVSSDKAFVMMKQFFGSDYPVCNLKMYIGGVLDEHLSDSELEAVFSENAKRVLGI